MIIKVISDFLLSLLDHTYIKHLTFPPGFDTQHHIHDSSTILLNANFSSINECNVFSIFSLISGIFSVNIDGDVIIDQLAPLDNHLRCIISLREQIDFVPFPAATAAVIESFLTYHVILVALYYQWHA